MFTKVPFRLGGQSILQIFTGRQIGLGQKAIFKELQQIKAFRNRIAHHEPICFDATGHKSMVYAQTNYALILKYIAFLGYDKDDLLFGIDVMPDAVMNQNTTPARSGIGLSVCWQASTSYICSIFMR